MREIALTRGKIAIVDDADYEWLSQWNWHCSEAGYAVRSRKKRPMKVFMHRDILQAHGDQQSDHINGDRLDNRRHNLRVVTVAQNTSNRLRGTRKHSPYKGASPGTRSPNRWYAKITGPDHKRLHLGAFDNARSAAIAHDFAALVLYGPHAAINGVVACHRKYAARCLVPEAT